MPLITPSTYRSPPLIGNGHLQTILPSLLRRVNGVTYRRERIATPDDDFLDLDWSSPSPHSRLVVLCHGLEGSTAAAYMKGMVRVFNRAGWSTLGINFRGCSGVPNRRLRSYHSGATDDLATVLEHVRRTTAHRAIGLIGFSLGGNLVLKYLGEWGRELRPTIRWAAAVSVPCDLKGGALAMARPACRIYMIRFLRTLCAKAKAKAALFDGRLRAEDFHGLRTFQQFDDRFTAPAHGFRDAEDYWRRCSARFFVDRIRIPTLLINARNDPFLDSGCYPLSQARRSAWLHLEIPSSGGHVGFVAPFLKGDFWHERRILSFAEAQTPHVPPGA
ncbi:MAG: alpha/beta fold hydrolase [Desulfobacterales bacterium]|nr:alpha/beta fold hydrolase [Desulfobacterales bacterium]